MPVTINNSNIFAGDGGDDGDLVLRTGTGDDRIRLNADGASGWFGGNGAGGDLVVFPSGGNNTSTDQATAWLQGSGGNLFLGGNGTDGDLVLRSGAGEDRIRLNADGASGWFGGNGAGGDLVVFPSGGNNTSTDQATAWLQGSGGNLFLGGNGTDGDVVLRSGAGEDRIRLDANLAVMWIGGNGNDGDIAIFASDGDNATLADATIHMDGASGNITVAGDITLQNADCAEDFRVACAAEAEPGTVMVIDDNLQLAVSDRAYDRRVAGIVAGAGDYRPGIVLGRTAEAHPTMPIALVGRACCKVDAAHGAVAIGDLLTSSPTAGHAMKAADPARAFGAVIGKALAPLDGGRGLIPVLVALQ